MTHSLDVSPRPKVDLEQAAQLAYELFGVQGKISELSSHQDRNFRVVSESSDVVLKIANKSWSSGALQAQNAALLFLSQQEIPFTAPVPIAGVNGQYIQTVNINGDDLHVRLITFVPGQTLTGEQYVAPCVRVDLGRLAGEAAKALEEFDHDGLTPSGQWDLMHGVAFVRTYLDSVTEPERRKVMRDRLDDIEAILEPIAGSLRIRAIHNDVTDDNTVGESDDAGRIRPSGIIDFGDMTRSWLVGDIAMTAASLLRHHIDHPFATMETIAAYHREVPLTEADVIALWPLITLRGAVLVAAGDHQASLDPDNAAATEPLEGERRIFDRAASIPFALAQAAIRATCDLPPSITVEQARTSLTSATTLFEHDNSIAVVDLSIFSDDFDNGRFTEPNIVDSLLAQHHDSDTIAISCYGEPYLSRTLATSADEPATIALGVNVMAPAGMQLRAPLDGRISHRSDERVVFETAAGLIYLDGVADAPAVGTHAKASSPLGTLATGKLWVQILVEASLHPAPAFCTPTEAAAWLMVSSDPSALFGIDVSAPSAHTAELLERRDRSFARLQEYYYDDPMQIERGWRSHLIDTQARSYLDMVNNVAVVGHGHPRLADAVERQMRKLNTNSRFHYRAIVEFTERLTALTSPELDTVFLVNSGSEAVDLALHIAQIATDRMDLVAVREAYHGWTLLSDAVTTSLYDNPKALETRPDWIHLVSAPNPYRGQFQGDGAADAYIAEFTNTVDSMCAQGTPPAAFICEPVFGNAGGVLLPEGYLAAAYDVIRRAGGLCIADEVQVGYGRLGHHWWAYQMHDVQPDIITAAKAMGNGQPLGAVITTAAIAQAFGDQGNFFSSAGGSPVSCIVGSTVLDIIKDEELQHNAAVVGDHIIARCSKLMDEYPIIGAVHGMGLYLGVELVLHRQTREPATAQCAAICERLRELGVIVQPTGERANVLKMKPPMTLTMKEADFYVDQLERVLRDGW